MFKISRESEINLVNVLIDNDIISGKDLIDIKGMRTEANSKSLAGNIAKKDADIVNKLKNM